MNRTDFVAFALVLLSAYILCPACMAGDLTVQDSVLTVPRGLQAIADRQFADRTDFHTVRFESPSDVKKIGDYAFMGCSNLRDIMLPQSVTAIGEGAFRECSSLTRMVLPQKVRKLERYTFAWCGNLQQVDMQNVLDVGSHAFAYCASLEQADFSPCLEHVGSNAFCFCSSLAVVSLPASVSELESYAFAECTSLRRAALPGNDKMLGELIFSGCRRLEEISEESPTPPTFDCNSTLFDDEEQFMYSRCRLLVPAKALDAYAKAQGWELFENISAK